MKTYSNYSQVEIVGVEHIPSHWKVAALKFLLKDGKDGIRIGPFGSSLKLEMMTPTGYKVYGQENVIKDNFSVGDRFVDENKFSELSDYEIKSDDIVVTTMGTTGKSKVVPHDIERGIMDSHLIRMRVDTDAIPEFISLVINDSDYILAQVEMQGRGSIMSGLNSTIIKSLTLAVPPMEEQRAILEYVDWKTKEIDNIIHKYTGGLVVKEDSSNTRGKGIVALLLELRRSLISEVVTGKIDVRDEVPAPIEDTAEGIPA